MYHRASTCTVMPSAVHPTRICRVLDLLRTNAYASLRWKIHPVFLPKRRMHIVTNKQAVYEYRRNRTPQEHGSHSAAAPTGSPCRSAPTTTAGSRGAVTTWRGPSRHHSGSASSRAPCGRWPVSPAAAGRCLSAPPAPLRPPPLPPRAAAAPPEPCAVQPCGRRRRLRTGRRTGRVVRLG